MIVLPLVATHHCQEVVNDVKDKEHNLMQITGRCTVCLRIFMVQGLVLYVWSVFDKHMPFAKSTFSIAFVPTH